MKQVVEENHLVGELFLKKKKKRESYNPKIKGLSNKRETRHFPLSMETGREGEREQANGRGVRRHFDH